MDMAKALLAAGADVDAKNKVSVLVMGEGRRGKEVGVVCVMDGVETPSVFDLCRCLSSTLIYFFPPSLLKLDCGVFVGV